MFQSYLAHISNTTDGMIININAVELAFLIFFIFQLGFLVGKQWQLKWIFKLIMHIHFQYLPSLIQPDIKNSPSILQNLQASDCLTMVAEKHTLDPQNVQHLFFQQKLPFKAPKRNTKANFQIILEKSASGLFKVEKYQQITEFQSNSSLAQYQFNKLCQTMERMTQTQNQGDKNGIQLKLSRLGSSSKTELLFKRICFKQPESKKIQIQGLCENGKFETLFQNIRKIGEGGFGQVYEATHRAEKKKYAIKKIFLKDLKKKDFLRQVTIVNHLTHTNMVRYYTWWIQEVIGDQRKKIEIQFDIQSPQLKIKKNVSTNSIPFTSNEENSIVFQDSGVQKPKQPILNRNPHQIAAPNTKRERQSFKIYSLHIQMQLYNDGTLLEYLKKKNIQTKPSKAFCIVKELLNGLEFLHDHGVIHRDLKPANIFLNKKDKLIKIGDFGLSVFVDKQVSLREYLLSNKLGTPCYMAPQIKQNSKIMKPQLLDVYSLGVIYFQLLKKFGSEHERVTKLKEIQFGTVDLSEHPLQRQLIRMMTRSYKTRLQISQIKETKQFKDLQKKYWGCNWCEQ